jgi:fructokinase
MRPAMIAVLGEAVVDLVEQGPGLYRAHPGGSPLNVAIGLGRLDRPVALHARISGDTFGRMFRRHLAASGVDDRALVAATEPSTLAVASVDADGVASYDFWMHGTADWQWTAAELAEPLADDVVALHTGSMTLEVEPGASQVLDLLRRERERGLVTISYDPNVRLARLGPADAGRRRVEDVVRLADLVKVSADDLDWLHPGEDPGEVAVRWVGGAGEDPAGGGPSLVVVTLGAAGSLAVTAGGARQRRPPGRSRSWTPSAPVTPSCPACCTASRRWVPWGPTAAPPSRPWTPPPSPPCSTARPWSPALPAPGPAQTRRPSPRCWPRCRARCGPRKANACLADLRRRPRRPDAESACPGAAGAKRRCRRRR